MSIFINLKKLHILPNLPDGIYLFFWEERDRVWSLALIAAATATFGSGPELGSSGAMALQWLLIALALLALVLVLVLTVPNSSTSYMQSTSSRIPPDPRREF